MQADEIRVTCFVNDFAHLAPNNWLQLLPGVLRTLPGGSGLGFWRAFRCRGVNPYIIVIGIWLSLLLRARH